MKSNTLAIILVIICTIFTSVGQLLWKAGINNMAWLFIFLGFVSYGLGAVLLITALRFGELSLVYPFIALSFVWVSLLSIQFLGETMNLFKWLGVAAIIVGVALIGRGSK